VLRHPELALVAKYAAFLGGIFLLLRAMDMKTAGKTYGCRTLLVIAAIVLIINLLTGRRAV